MNQDSLILSFRITQLTQNPKTKEIGGKLVAQKTALTIKQDSLMSPGTRASAEAELTKFLRSAANKTCNLIPEGIQPRELFVKELDLISKLVSEGSRVVDIFTFSDKGDQTIVIQVKEPQ